MLLNLQIWYNIMSLYTSVQIKSVHLLVSGGTMYL